MKKKTKINILTKHKIISLPKSIIIFKLLKAALRLVELKKIISKKSKN